MATLVMMCGLSGTGKSSVGRQIADAYDAVTLRSDEIRREGESHVQRYSAEGRNAVYMEMMRRAKDELAAGRSVVLDATFLREEHRALTRDLAGQTGAQMLVVHVTCDDATAEQRITARAAEGTDPSEVTIDTRRRQSEEWQAIVDPHVLIRTDGTREQVADQVREILGSLARN